jgi:hypothetical protein
VSITFVLVTELAVTRATAGVYLGSVKMSLKRGIRPEAQKASQADELMTNIVVVLEVAFESQLVFECGETQVAKYVMIHGVFDMILEAVSVFENALTKVAVVPMALYAFHVVLKCDFVSELERAHAAPVLVWIRSFINTSRTIW